MKFRKKPVVIEAWQARELGVPAAEPMPVWLMSDNRAHFFTDGSIEIDTLEGKMKASIGDWIIKGVKGEIYPCKPDIFAATYEAVTG